MKKIIVVLLAMLVLVSALVPCFGASSEAAQESLFEPGITVRSDAYVLAALGDDGAPVLCQKNANKRKYPASLTKVVTAMVVLENVKDLQQKATVSKAAVQAIANTDAQHAGLRAGQRVRVEQLLNLALVFSACDACQVLAEQVGGNVKKFVKMMNAWAADAGCTGTHFVNPDGLHHKKQYSTANDLYKIMLKALENETFMRISCTRSYRFGNSNYPHTNRMLHKSDKQYYYAYAKGIKTGYTKQAGRCLITLGEKDGRRYLAILLDAPLITVKKKKFNTAYSDAKALFEWAFDFRECCVLRAEQVVMKVSVRDGTEHYVNLVPKEAVSLLLPRGFDGHQITVKAQLPNKRLNAPILKEQAICKAQLLYKGQALGTLTLVAAERVRVSWWARFCRLISRGS